MAFNNYRVAVGRFVSIRKPGLRTVGKDNTSVIDITVAINNRVKKNGEWEDGPTEYLTGTAWGQMAKNLSEWVPGDAVILVGEMEMKEGYTNKEGVEYPAAPHMKILVAGHDESYYPATQDRPKRDSDSSSSRPAAKKTTSASQPKANTNTNTNSDLDFDDDEDLF